ncbi:helix-turn-helix domain-containing protein [Cetobacterium sp. 8H]|uniref:BglG family transcription antiterminator n=1 Tax=Cetobacterium sp. 8H TaxID=2759681 RepID=UPI00163CB4B5|nr:helix-turn-helix domain-containing protein [Cetobacterium sp. 8H]
MNLTKSDLNFIKDVIKANNKKISPSNFPNLKVSQFSYKMDKINFLLKIMDKKTLKKRFGNYYINSIEDLIELTKTLDFSKLDKKERISTIFELLLLKNKINISNLEDLFYQSRSSVKKDLKEVKEILKKYNLTLEYHYHLGLSIEGKESDTRFFYLNYFFENHIFFKNKLEKKSIEYLVFNILKGKNSSFETSKILNIAITIQYYRILNHNFLTSLKEPIFTINNDFSEEFNVYSKFLEKISNNYSVYYEKNFLLFFLTGLCYSKNSLIVFKKENLFNDSLKEFLTNIGLKYNLNFFEDNYLIKTLGAHLKSTIFKLSYRIPITNPCITDDLSDFSEFINTIKKEIKIFEKNFNLNFNLDSIIFIFFHIKSSMIRIEKNRYKRKKILLVCNLGVGASEVLENQLLKYFRINIVDTVSYYQYQVHELKNIDYIIHTVDNLKSKIPSTKVNPLLTKLDLKNLEKEGFIKL